VNSNPSGSNLLDSAQKKGSVTNTPELSRALLQHHRRESGGTMIIGAVVDDELAIVFAAVLDGEGPDVLYQGFLAGNYRFISGNFRWGLHRSASHSGLIWSTALV